MLKKRVSGLLEALGKIHAMHSDTIKMLRKMLSKGRCKLQEDFCEALTRVLIHPRVCPRSPVDVSV